MSEGEKPVVVSTSDIRDGAVPMYLQHVTINGHDVAYRTAGDGPVVLLVHGMAGSSVTWKYVTDVVDVVPDVRERLREE